MVSRSTTTKQMDKNEDISKRKIKKLENAKGREILKATTKIKQIIYKRITH